MDKIRRSYDMTLTNDDSVLCYSKAKGMFLWSMESKALLSSTPKLSIAGLCFSGDDTEIAVVTENPSSIHFYRIDKLDKPFFRYSFQSKFIPRVISIDKTNIFIAGCYDSLYYINPSTETVNRIYKTDDGCCKFIMSIHDKLFVVFDRIKSDKYASACVELQMDRDKVADVKTYDLRETTMWFVETPRKEKYIALSGWKSFKICHVNDWNKMEIVYEIESMVERTFVSGNNGIAGILLQEGENEIIKLISLNRKVKQLYESNESKYVSYPSISNSGNYLLIPHSKESKIISIKGLMC